MNSAPYPFLLHYRKGQAAWQEFPLLQNEIILGRSADCHLSLQEAKASRHHATLVLANGQVWLKDLGSKNGTQMGGIRLAANTPRQLTPGETFTIGAYEFYITQAEAGATRLAVPGQFTPAAAPSSAGRPPRKTAPWLGISAAVVGGGLLLLCLCVGGYFLLSGSNNQPSATQIAQAVTSQFATSQAQNGLVQTSPSSASQPAEAVTKQASASLEPTQAGPLPTEVNADKQTWLVMLYENGDDSVLEYDIFTDVNEAERVGSTDRVKIVTQLDRYKGAFDGDGNWTTTKRFYLTKDDDMDHIRSKQIADLGEVNMADPNSLVDFVSWASSTYPADKYVLVISDHGGGWTGISWDPDPPTEDGWSDGMEINELDYALQQITQTTAVKKLELIGLDACLMAQMEVFTALAPYSRYAVASEEVVPALGFAYTGFLGALANNPAMSGADLAKAIVSTFIEQDQRVVDDKLRARDWEGEISAADAAAYEMAGTTISAVDLSKMAALNVALGNMVNAMAKGDQSQVAAARTYAHPFYNIFSDLYPASFIDLVNFAEMSQSKNDSADVKQTAGALVTAVQQAVIAEKHGPKVPASSGIAIYFPNSGLYGTQAGGYDAYTAQANRFAKEAIWDDFLSFHYTHTPVGSGVPQPGAQISAPGASGVSISPIAISSDTVASDGSVTLTSEVTGQNIGYIYLLVGYYEKETDLVLLADAGYINSDRVQENGGVYYPDWGDSGVVSLNVEWKPVLWSISNGSDSRFALVQPEQYGASSKENVFAVKGMYTFGSSGEKRYAKIFFGSDGVMQRVVGFTGQGGTGAPREISPSPGDKFTILNQWVKWSKIKEGVVEIVEKEGGALTFLGKDFTYEGVVAEPLPYYIGFMVEDLDGNRYGQFTTVTVKPK